MEWIEARFHPERAGTGLPDPGVMTVKQMPVVACLVLAEVSTVWWVLLAVDCR